LAGLQFAKSGFYVNTSRADPEWLTVESRMLKIAGTDQVAVCLMLGTTNECALIDVGYSGPPSSAFTVHKISIAPFSQEMRRDSSCWGQLFQFQIITGPVSPLGISFSTRKESGNSSGILYILSSCS
jgi:hypothetical protein